MTYALERKCRVRAENDTLSVFCESDLAKSRSAQKEGFGSQMQKRIYIQPQHYPHLCSNILHMQPYFEYIRIYSVSCCRVYIYT